MDPLSNAPIGGNLLAKLPTENPNLYHYNVGGTLFTYHKDTIETLAKFGGEFFSNLYNPKYEVSSANRPQPYIEVHPGIFEKFIDPYIRFMTLPNMNSILHAQELSTLQDTVRMLGLTSLLPHLARTSSTAQNTTPSIKNLFGPELWKTHIADINRDKLPAMPSEWEQIKNNPSPFFAGKTIAQTETLVLAPSWINEEKTTLSELTFWLRQPKKGPRMKIDNSAMQDNFEDPPLNKSYWFSMTNQKLSPDDDKYSEIFGNATEYSLPTCLEATMFIAARHFMHTRVISDAIACRNVSEHENEPSNTFITCSGRRDKLANIIILSESSSSQVRVPCRRFL